MSERQSLTMRVKEKVREIAHNLGESVTLIKILKREGE